MNGSDVLDDLLEVGERLIGKGWRVIPCNGKVPCDYRGLPCDGWNTLPATAERLRIGLRAAAEPGIGLVMGAESKVIDIEVDDDNEIKARDHLWRDVDRPVATAFQSKRGRHDLYSFDHRLASILFEVLHYSDDEGNTVKIRLGTNAGGAQSVIPPTAPRRWIEGLSPDDVNPAPLPEIVVQRLLACAAAKRKKSPQKGSASGVHPTALDVMRKCGGNMVDGLDGSKRLFAYSCRGVELNCSDAEIIATIRAMEAEKPFPRGWSDDEILARIRDAEQTVERGSEVVISNFSEVEIETPGLLSDGSAGEGESKTITVPKTMGEITAPSSNTAAAGPSGSTTCCSSMIQRMA